MLRVRSIPSATTAAFVTPAPSGGSARVPGPARRTPRSARSRRPVARATVVSPAAAATLALVAVASPAGATESTFDAGAEGWSIVELPGPPYDAVVTEFAPVWEPGAGNPGGAIRTTDLNGNLFMFSAPAAYLGDQSAALGSSLRYDLLFEDDGLPPGSFHPDLVLHGAGLTLAVDGFTDPPAQTGAWTSFDVCLGTAAGWRIGDADGPLATEQQILDWLGDLQGLFIRGDYWAGAETTRLDNVRLGARSRDLDGDGTVGFDDLLTLLAAWGPCPTPADGCGPDIDCSGTVDFDDLLTLLSAWTG